MDARYVIDFGSRTIKLHRQTSVGSGLLAVQNWDPIGRPECTSELGNAIDTLIRTLPPTARIFAIGTAAARRKPALANSIHRACTLRGIAYRTISQRREARLIRRAFCGGGAFDIVNVGGGSIQIVHRTGGMTLLEFGISDLNAKFGLAAKPQLRKFSEAREFLRRHIPHSSHPFVYVGGEKKYLRSFGAHFDARGHCSTQEFLKIARRLEALELEQMERESPFGPGWMSGANASNAIVETCLKRTRSGSFIPSDINIGDGFVAQTLAEREHAENDHI